MSQLEPPIGKRPLPRDVVEARLRHDSGMPQIEHDLKPYIADLIASSRRGLSFLASVHAGIVDQSDIDLDAPTRWVASWELSGHAIALGNALLDQLEAGHTVETAGTVRMLDEALTQLLAVTGGDESLVARWLDGKQLTAKDARRGQGQFLSAATADLSRQGMPIELHPIYRAQRTGLIELGVDPDKGLAGVLAQIDGRVYGSRSQAAHNNRPTIEPNIARGLRRFSYGPHPDYRVRLGHALAVTSHIETLLLNVGMAMGEIVGLDAIRRSLVPLLQHLGTELDSASQVLA